MKLADFGLTRDRYSYWFVLASASFMILMAKFLLSNYTPLLPVIIREMKISYSEAGLIFTASVGISVITAFAVGPLADRFKVTKIALIALLLLIFASALSGMVSTYHQMLLARAALGMYPFVFVAGSKLVADTFPAKKMGLAQGIFGAASTGGPSLAAATLPFLAEGFGWRNAVVVASFGALPAIMLSLLLSKVQLTRPKVYRSDTLVGFYKSRNPWLLFFLNSVPFGSQLILTAWLPTFLVDTQRLSLTSAGTLASISFALAIAGRIVGGWLADRYGARKLLIISPMGLCLSYGMMAFESGLLGYFAVLATGWLFGFYAGAIFAIVPRIFGSDTGKAVSMAGTGGNLAAFVITPIVGVLVDYTGGYAYGMLLLAAMTISSAPLGVLLSKAAYRSRNIVSPA